MYTILFYMIINLMAILYAINLRRNKCLRDGWFYGFVLCKIEKIWNTEFGKYSDILW